MLCEAPSSVSMRGKQASLRMQGVRGLDRYVSFFSTEQLPLFELLAARQPGVHTALKAVSRIQDHFSLLIQQFGATTYIHAFLACAFSTPAGASMRSRTLHGFGSSKKPSSLGKMCIVEIRVPFCHCIAAAQRGSMCLSSQLDSHQPAVRAAPLDDASERS
ncbi:hypothetical protein OH76DRAFT_828876 [Lentinus brumalis]|uniref:Uncharacterized protein n=1 Tax=Lentinus brumalis TaxID=2498619 RepID=A0A371D2F8_9APHY|nr:hypothetical protein OH76DRAFT_828876 [Polyporus brumalis]